MLRRAAAACLIVLAGCGGGSGANSTPDASANPPTDGAAADVAAEESAPDGRSEAATIDSSSPMFDAGPDGTSPGARFVYVGADDQKIHLYGFDTSSGALSPRGSYQAGNYPSFLAFDIAHQRLFATNENANMVAAFALDPGTGALTAKGGAATAAGPTHVAVDATGAWVFTANYGGGSAQVFPVQNDGSLGVAAEIVTPGALVHCVVLDATGHFAFVVAKGSDLVAEYTFDESSGALAPNPNGASVATPPGAGPRHLTFHPRLPAAYLMDELDSMVRVYAYDAVAGTLSERQAISTLPMGFTGTNTGAEIAVSPSGAFVYGSNRGDDSIVVYSVSQATGLLSFVARTPSGGMTPRHFSLDPTGTWLVAANQNSGNVVTFRVDPTQGTLSQVAMTLVGAAPFYVRAIATGP